MYKRQTVGFETYYVNGEVYAQLPITTAADVLALTYRCLLYTSGVNTFYMDTKDGHMLHDLVNIQGKNYYFDVNGFMQKGFVNIGGLTYLFGADGSMQYGWFTDEKGVRYFQEDGSMAMNKTLVLDGKTRCV